MSFRIDELNVPLARPGVYILRNEETARVYIGASLNVLGRCKGHEKGESSKKLKEALLEYGTRTFSFTPVLYSLDRKMRWLLEMEAILIAEYDSIKDGYNVISEVQFEAYESARNSLRQYYKNNPEESGRHFKEWWANLSPEDKAQFLAKREPARLAAVRKNNSDPAFIERMVLATHTPEVNARRNASIVATFAKPGGKDKLLAAHKDPAYLENQRQKGLARFATDESRQAARDAQAKVADKCSESLKAAWKKRPRIWITNGIVTQHHFVDEVMLEGFHQGRGGLFGRAAAKANKKRNRVLLED